MKASELHTNQKRIENLTLKEIDMIYSLVRIGQWADSEISRVYKLAVDDVHKVFDNYPQLREEFLNNPPREATPQAPESELSTKTPRKRRSDAQYATTAERQAAYRARLKEKPSASLERPSSANETDSSAADSESNCNGLPAPEAETDSECPDAELLT